MNQIDIMDTKVEKKQSKIKIILLALGAIVGIGAFLMYFFQQKKTFTVKQDAIQIEEVSEGKF